MDNGPNTHHTTHTTHSTATGGAGIGFAIGALVVAVLVVGYFLFSGAEIADEGDINISVEGAGEAVEDAGNALESAAEGTANAVENAAESVTDTATGN